ncbi:hypothetical protein [Pedobacter endophyticus]|uniref:Lipoprotein n=1 Tax=Pedobacter endophyticus TaxID=2789740 RepID=A0A7S9Q0R0_9SPHI|nr:hypothetical protein [Pedobacter endophyticus]QPH41046.1 hypothetical protein IZT61_07240 [Pedobacter endophyticus]
MKNILSSLAVASALFASCQGGPAKKTQAKIDSTIVTNSETTANAATCYQYVKNRDTANLSLTEKADSVTGNLGYKWYEKDKNAGTISGVVKGDTIIADYTFQSEGRESVRQVAWLKKGDQLVEAFGDVEEIDGKMKFKDLSKLKFDSGLVFSKADCK